MGLRAIDKIRFVRGKARKSRWCEVKNIELLTGYPAPLHRVVRSNNHDRRYDRRDAWVELSFRPETDYERALVGMAEPSTRAKWRAPLSARTSTPKKCLTPPTLSERRFFINNQLS